MGNLLPIDLSPRLLDEYRGADRARYHLIAKPERLAGRPIFLGEKILDIIDEIQLKAEKDPS